MLKEFLGTFEVSFKSSSTIKVMDYFNDVYKQIQKNLYATLHLLSQDYGTYQYIFTGHSLGAGMAAIFAYDAVETGNLTQTQDSPVLINFGQPRVGNDYFSNSLMNSVPLIFRVVRQGDLIPTLPNCNSMTLGGVCQTILKGSRFSKKLPQPKTKNNSSYPWSSGGLKLFNDKMTLYNDCGIVYGENNPDLNCAISRKIDIDLHTHYFTSLPVKEICSK